MRSRLLVSTLLTLFAFALPAHAQDAGDRYADGLIAGDYLRFSGGIVAPVHPQGSLRDWNRGQNFALVYENWANAGAGVSQVAYGLNLGYSRLPLNEPEFIAHNTTIEGARLTSATASSAAIFELGTGLRLRFPMLYVMPNIQFAFSYIDYRPATIHYVATSGPGTASQQHRRGAALSIGGGLDKRITSYVGIFGEALYTYGFTGLGQGIASPGGACVANGCDVLKNTTIGVVRGGLRVRTSR